MKRWSKQTANGLVFYLIPCTDQDEIWAAKEGYVPDDPDYRVWFKIHKTTIDEKLSNIFEDD